jgi:hypothetical protein
MKLFDISLFLIHPASLRPLGDSAHKRYEYQNCSEDEMWPELEANSLTAICELTV